MQDFAQHCKLETLPFLQYLAQKFQNCLTLCNILFHVLLRRTGSTSLYQLENFTAIYYGRTRISFCTVATV